jgi:DNA polymerase-3 subunit delta
MPATSAHPAKPVVLVWGEDDFSVRQRAREVFAQWAAPGRGADAEIIDAGASNSGEALKALARLREALQTLPFFGSEKVVWFKDCSFLGDDRTATAQAVTESLAGLAQELQRFRWQGVRLLISAGKVDKRRTFYKALEKLGTVEAFAALSVDDRNWTATVEAAARRLLKGRQKEISEEALALLATCTGPNLQQVQNEAEKLALYVGERREVAAEDVRAVAARSKQARSFALADALGDRHLPRVLRCLDEELWSLRLDRQKSEIGLLYGLISKVRVLLLLQEMLAQGWIKPAPDYDRFKLQLARVPAERLPKDRRFNPLAMNPYVLFKALPQARNYSREELVRAMERLLECNQQLVGSSLDEALVLQRTLVEIVGRSEPAAARQLVGAAPAA